MDAALISGDAGPASVQQAGLAATAGHGRGRELRLHVAQGLLQAAAEALPASQAEARGAIAQALALLAHPGPGPSAAGPGRLSPPLLRRVGDHIEANLASALRIGDLARVAGLGASHFSAAFRRSTGESPYAYVLRRRIERAQHLMRATDAPLAEIAIDCGLADQSHLTRLFRRATGMSPAAWRRLTRAADAGAAAAGAIDHEEDARCRPSPRATGPRFSTRTGAPANRWSSITAGR